MLDNSKEITVHRFFCGTGASYDQIVNLFTFGFDNQWKKRILDMIPGSARHIVDQACGTGILTFRIAARFPASRITGVELRDEYLNIARNKAARSRTRKVDFLLGRAEEIVLPGPVDCITSSYLAKYADLEMLIRNAHGMLSRGGRLIMHDFTYPANRPFTYLWRFYFKLLQTIASRIYPEWRTVFFELPEFLEHSPWIRHANTLLEKYGFYQIRTEYLTWHTAAIITGSK